jgi:putative transcriptional regulator
MPKEEGPAPEEIIAARHAAKLTQTEAATLVHSKLRAWQRWEAGDRIMPAAVWELFQIKTKRKRA